MPENENQEMVSYRDRIVDRMKTRFPDRDFSGESEQDNLNNLEKSVAEYIEEVDARLEAYGEQNRGLVDLFDTNPRAAEFFNVWYATRNPAAAFRQIYGNKAFEALTSPEGAKILDEIEAEDAKAAESAAERDRNYHESIAALDSWGDEKGLDDNQKFEVFKRFNDILQDALRGVYSRDLFEMGWKADHYSADIDSARHEGEVAGRNARIQETQRQRRASESIPPAFAGQGTRTEEPRPVRNSNPWML